jgi:modification methylase
MRPYYDDGTCQIFLGDCQEVLPELASVDLVVTSPPYNMGPQSGAYANMRDGYHSHSDNLPDHIYVAWQREILAALWHVVAPHGAIFYNHKPLIRDGTVLLPTRYVPDHVLLRQVIVWYRRVGMNWSPRHFCPQHEWVLLLAHKAFCLTSRKASVAGDVWSLAIDQSGEGHPCAFPVSLPTKAIAATEAKVILDPFMGSGTTLRAAKNLGRKAIGIEIEEKYCEIAARRLGQEVLALSP